MRIRQRLLFPFFREVNTWLKIQGFFRQVVNSQTATFCSQASVVICIINYYYFIIITLLLLLLLLLFLGDVSVSRRWGKLFS